jgi:hypothetical protein
MPLALLIAALLPALPAEPPDLRAVMARAGAYVAKYQQDFSLLLADERYVQEVADATKGPANGARGTPGGAGAATETRVLVSEFALVRVEDAGRTLWLAFRDVVEVDGRPVRDREERLQRLFRTPPANALAQAQAIAFASARYNIGDVVRTVNVPTLALEFLEPAAQARSRFRKAAEEMVDGVRAWVVSFEERARPTRIRTTRAQDVKTKGLVWIDPDTGRILKSELDPQFQRGLRARLTTAYAPDERLQMWVPVAMKEVYEMETRTLTGTATYTNFRRFETDVRLLGVK